MEGLLCRWALAIQEYDFQIEYKKGSQNGNVDALSRRSIMAITHAGQPLDGMQRAERNDPTISVLYTTLLSKKTPAHFGNWRQHPLRRYRQIVVVGHQLQPSSRAHMRQEQLGLLASKVFGIVALNNDLNSQIGKSTPHSMHGCLQTRQHNIGISLLFILDDTVNEMKSHFLCL